MKDVNDAVNSGIEKTITDFQHHPHYYFTEEDVRWRLLREIENALAVDGSEQITYSGGVTSVIHTEYPTPFRCSMSGRRFELLDISDKKGQRGHFDIVVLNPTAAARCDFETLRSQYYKVLCDKLKAKAVPLPLLEYAIELKLFRDLAHPNRTESAGQQAEYAMQAVRKLDATVQPNDYYSKPFAKLGIALLFDNSELVCDGFKIDSARKSFFVKFSELNWKLFPNALSCIWVAPKNRIDFIGAKTVSYL
jgi:hypothetical protein